MTDTHRFNIQTGRLAAGGSRQGPKHLENEDSFRLSEPDRAALRASHGNLYVVADGVGGHLKGEVASALAVESVERAYFAAQTGDPVTDLIEAVGQANRRVHESAAQQTDEGLPMATTVVAAAVLDDQIIVANVGDSRAYVVGDGQIRQLSHDHSWVQDQLDSGKLTPEEARHNPRRNIITRALGLDHKVEAEVKTETDTGGQTRLVLCSDGVHGVIDDDELAAKIEGVEPQAAVESVLALVEERKGRDDATLVVVEVGTRVSIEEEEHPAQADFFPRIFRIFRRRR
ncbi:MAG TPA: protein phosphatase 2C domain-containing protein [Dehalococcoidia bacterium]|nr:protein phosphatase 2C domain-containing protein [Dehalococcoidia bacterium]